MQVAAIEEQLERAQPLAIRGQVTDVVGLTVSAADFPAPLGARCAIVGAAGRAVRIEAEVVGFRGEQTLLMPLADFQGVRRGDAVELVQARPLVRVGERLLGRVIDGRGRFLDAGGTVVLEQRRPLVSSAPAALERPRIDQALSTGVRAIDGLLTLGCGQRVGIFSGSGVGKSVLLGMLARNGAADVNVVALIGERGREVREFVERDLNSGLARSVVVVATSDEPAPLRVQAALRATAIAEFFRDRGRNVLLMMDSVTRLALAQREIGLAAGEPPATRGFPPSVFALLPRVLERAGRSARGSITGLFSVLVEGDDPSEPIADAVRGILDGHIWLARKLATRAHWPAIDVTQSISRLMPEIVPEEHRRAADGIKELMAAYEQHEDLISLGAYQSGSNAAVDAALRMREAIAAFLRQDMRERSSLAEAREGLYRLAALRRQVSGAGQAA